MNPTTISSARINKIRDQARDSVEYKIESAKIDYSEQISERLETLGLTQIELAKRMGGIGALRYETSSRHRQSYPRFDGEDR